MYKIILRIFIYYVQHNHKNEMIYLRSLSKKLEMRGIDPRASHMLSERSTIWATPP